MVPILTAFAVLAAAQAVAPQAAPAPPKLSLEQSTALRCGVGFAVVSRLQREGKPEGAKYPVLGERGKEFFVRTTAAIMDQTGADRAVIGDMVTGELADLVDHEDQLGAMMPSCLILLDASGI